MRIGILCFGQLKSEVTMRIQEALSAAFSDTQVHVIQREISLPRAAFSEPRKQYQSDIILGVIKEYAETNLDLDLVLGIVDVDIFVPRLNFVFGEAEHPGRAALISLWRLRPEFHQQTRNGEVFEERSAKEAVHEIGHTLGLDHCDNPFCVMHFSNSILETDVKKNFFCSKCAAIVETALGEFGKSLEKV